MKNTKIDLKGTTLDAIVKMSDGNLGAAVALSNLIGSDQNALSKILWLDEWGIYGAEIYVLYSDICDKDIKKMAAVIEATIKLKFDHRLLKNACSRQDYSGRDIVPVEHLVLLMES